MSEATPVPWHPKHDETDDNMAWVKDADGGSVAIVLGAGHDLAENWANASLMAAAPDLLAACQEFVRKVECGEARSQRSYAQMKAAIAKARGGAQ